MDETKELQRQARANKSQKERITDWAKENRYGIVFGSWVASMGISLAIVGRNPYLTGPQKLVQA
ncbi:Replication factor C, subunit RFC4, partial [Cryomyces antarcticus]